MFRPAPQNRTRQQPVKGCEYHMVGPVQLRPGVLPPQHRNLLTQHQQFGVLRRRKACEQRHPPGQANEYQVEHPHRHKLAMLPPQDSCRRRTHRSATCVLFWESRRISEVLSKIVKIVDRVAVSQVDALMDGGRQRLRRGFRVIETMIWP